MEIKFIEKKNTSKVAEFISYLFACRTISHILHLKTNSFATHKAMNSFYDEILELTDSIAEKSSGMLGAHLSGYKDFPIAQYENANPLTYLKEVLQYVKVQRYIVFDRNNTPIQNELDSVENLINETLYLLSLS
jgi:hypothetical protein